MTDQPDQTGQAARIERKITQARLGLGFERLWNALHWPIVILATAATLVLSGIMPLLPPVPRLAGLAVLAVGLLGSLRPLFRLRWPGRSEAIRRVELTSGLAHRPVAGREDRLAEANPDPVQQAIWEEHQLRQLRGLTGLKAGAPHSSWRDIDPRALRLPAALALVAALLLGSGDHRGNIAASLAVTAPAPATEVALDAWLKPPAYTGKPPVLLTSPAMTERLKTEPEIAAPEKSVLTLRIAGAANPSLSFHAPGGNAEAPAITGFKPAVKRSEGQFQAEVLLDRPALVKAMDGNKELAAWRISLIPDAPPSVEIVGEPSGDPSGTLTAKWKVADDYGVTGVTADIYLADEQDEGFGFSNPGIFEFAPPRFPIQLRKAQGREEAGESKADVAEHPWAGFMVEMTLTATDAAGNSRESEMRVFRLPEREFTRILARAMIEQRRRLILNPEEAGGVAEMLQAILTYPAGLIGNSGTHLAIATALSRLRTARDRAGIDEVIGMLWQIAVNIEDGAFASAKAELDALRKELQRALREGAPPERIAELTRKLKEALDRYLQSMMEEARKRMAEGQPGDRNQAQPDRMVSPQDLQRMLDMIDKLAQSGDNKSAEQLLSQLEDILRNLRPAMPQQGQGQGQDSPLNEMLDQLSDLMRQQQKLMDDTQRMLRPDPFGDGESQEGQQGQQGMGGLGDRQQGLGKMLEDLMRQFGQNGMPAPESFGEAGRSMQDAEGALRGGDREQALEQQGEALSKLREGARNMARQMLQQSQGQQQSQGRDGEARGDDLDPLGRPRASRGEDTGPDRDMLPSEQAIQRAREILDLLRSRAGDTGLPRLERDYIERLLRGLY
jgi:uncharacterized protein (TIGR02302 family)